MSKAPTVLFYTGSDFGQANVVLATVYELLKEDAIHIHIASFPSLEPRLEQVFGNSQRKMSIAFHNLASAPGLTDYLNKRKARRRIDVPHPPGRRGAERIELLTSMALAMYDPKEHLSLFEWAAKLAEEIDPELVVIDPFLTPIHDTVRYLGRKYAVLSPCSLGEGLIPTQPWLSRFWKYPAFATGYRFPVPWTQIIDNIVCYNTSKKCMHSPRVTELNQARYARGITGPLGTFTPWVKDVIHISSSMPEIDLPMAIPDNVRHCGPILFPLRTVESVDPELSSWLQRRPTILMAFGTHFEAYSDTVREQSIAVDAVLRMRPDLQVLWKLKADGASGSQEGGNVAHLELQEYIGEDRVRIVNWLEADPIDILMSGGVVCSVHHGGANSYFESLYAGVPQVVLATWFDTFDYATRVEYLGVGVYGNRIAGESCHVDMANYRAPTLVRADEFADAMVACVGRTEKDELALAKRTRAADLGRLCQNARGRVESARVITKLCFDSSTV